MIEIEVAAFKHLAAVLAGVLVALEHVVSRKLHFLFRQPIKNQQYNHTRDANLEGNRRDHFVIRRVGRNIAPAIEIMRQEIVRFIRGNNVGMPRIYQRKGAAGRADVDRLPEAVQHQNLAV